MSEFLTGPPKQGYDERRSQKTFDVLASVDLYRYDLQTTGYVRPETKQRVYQEELTYIAEGLNRPLYTEFVLHEQDGELVYFHAGKWRTYVGSLASNLQLAENEARADPRRGFLAERAAEDLEIGYRMMSLQPGQRLAWKSTFPEREAQLYGEKFISEECGFQPQRKMGFIYEVEKTYDGRTVLRTQSVDGNDRDAFEAAMSAGRSGTIENMRGAYDRVMSAKYGADFYAGRPQQELPPEENAWSEVIRHRDLIEDFYLNKIQELSLQNLPRDELENAKKRLTYGVWAALKKRLDKQVLPMDYSPEQQAQYYAEGVQAEVNGAYTEMSARGEVLFGCGGAIQGEDAILNAKPGDVFDSIFGNRSEKKWMGCPFCGSRQYGDPCSSNIKCSDCSAEIKNGEVKSKGDGGSRRRKQKQTGSFFVYWAQLSESVRQEQQTQKAREEIKKVEAQEKLTQGGLGLRTAQAKAL